MQNNFNFFQNTECRYFPCHGGDRGTGSVPIEDFNCLFCYCPLYWIECDGNYEVLENGNKDCIKCTRNHDKDAYKFVTARTREYLKYKNYSRIDLIGRNGGDGEHYE